jgi:hypothetical protein
VKKIYKQDYNKNLMPNEKSIDEDIEKLNEEIEKYSLYRKLSKGALYTGVLGLAVATAVYYLTGEPDSEVMKTSYRNLNDRELIPTLNLAISSALFFGGGSLYFFFDFLQDSLKKKVIEEEYKETTRNLRKNELEEKLKN